MDIRRVFTVIMYITITKATTVIMVITTTKATTVIIIIKANMAIMVITTIKVNTATKVITTIKVITIIKVNMVIRGNKYITKATTTFIRKLFFIKLIKANTVTMDSTTKANIMDTITKAIKATTVIMGTMASTMASIMATTVNSTNSTNNISNINNSNNLLLGQVELEQGQQGQRQEQLVLVEQQDTRGTWVINELQKKRHNKKLLGNPSSFFQLLGADVRFQHEVVALVLASLLVLKFCRRLRGSEVFHQGIALPCLRYLQFQILYQDVRPFLQTCRMQSK